LALARKGVVMERGSSTMGVRIEPIVCHRDHRGGVFEPLDAEHLPRQRHVHVVVTEPGGVRGNHSHTRATEVLIVQGPALVRVRDAQGVQDTLVPEGGVTRFTIPPGVGHAVHNHGTRPMLLVAFRDRTDDPADPDVVREILIEVCPSGG
jgi:UDP-2-acetamido-2,6-beta-L-arabino-hexul-4-ose reductase